MPKQSKKVVYSKKCKGVQFEVRETGMNFSLYAKEKSSKPFKRFQGVSDLRGAKQIINNQRECRK